MSGILENIASIVTSGATGGVISVISSAAKTAEIFAEKSQQGQLLDAGEARAHAENLKALNEQLHKFKEAADRVDSDPEYAQRVLDNATIRD